MTFLSTIHRMCNPDVGTVSTMRANWIRGIIFLRTVWVWWYYTSTLKKLKFYRLHSESAVTSNRQLRCKKIQIPLHFCSRLRLFRTSLYTMTFVMKGHPLLTRCRFNLLHYPYYWPSAFLGVTNAHEYLTSGGHCLSQSTANRFLSEQTSLNDSTCCK